MYFLRAVFAILRLTVSYTGLAAILYFIFFTVALLSMLLIPVHGPLLHGMTCIVLGAGWPGLNRTGKPCWILELALFGAAALRSLEYFLYAFLSLDALHFCGDVVYSRERKTGLRRFGERLLPQAGMAAGCWSIWRILAFTASGRILRGC
jgi:hypothetical protein